MRGFLGHVRSVEAAVIHTYQITAYRAVREADPKDAARHWQKMMEFCEAAVATTMALTLKFPTCGTPGLCNLA
jgi:cytochrome c-type biogenesis protein CcmH/NrfG